MKPLNPKTIHPPFADYPHGIEVQPGRMVVTSGQLGVRADGTIPEDIESQTSVCLENIEAILLEAGLSRNSIVRLNAYVIDREWGVNGAPVISKLGTLQINCVPMPCCPPWDYELGMWTVEPWECD